MKKHIFFVLILAASIAYSKNIQIEMLKYADPQAYKKAKEIENIKKRIVAQRDGDIVYCLVSGSIGVDYMKKVVFEISSLTPNTNTKLIFVVQGFFSDELAERYNELQKQLSEYEYKELFQSNTKLIVDPTLFKKFHIEKVPALMYATYTKDTYSSNSDIKYIARGDILPARFFHLISTKDSNFEKYTHYISLLY